MQQYLLKNNLVLTVREAEANDAEKLLVFADQVAGESDNLTFGPGELGMTLDQERSFLQKCANSPTLIHLLAEINGEIIGGLDFHTNNRPRVRHSGEFGVTVRRDYWNLGIGGYLLTSLINWATNGGIIRKINLHVRVDNLPAIHLYEKYGFVHEGRITRELYIRGELVDTYLMGLQIDPLSIE